MSKIKVECDNCGGIIERCPNHIKRRKHHFCNRKCDGEWRSRELCGKNSPSYKGGGIKVKCDNCGNIVTNPSNVKRNNHNFCCTECGTQWMSEHLRGENNPNYKQIEIKCDNCEKTIKRKPSQVERSRHHFCNRKCHAKWLSKDKRNRERLRKIGSNIRSPTKPELIFKEICERNNLPFHYVGNGQLWIGKNPSVNPDFVECNGKKIAIEIFSYWHDSLKRHCKVPYSQTYKGRKKLLKRYGWKLVVFWQEDLEREDAEAFVLSIFLKKKGERRNLSNYFSPTL